MQTQRQFNTLNTADQRRTGPAAPAAIALAAAAAAAAALAGLVWNSAYAPLLAGGVCAAGLFVLTWLRWPQWGCYTALLMVLLPAGLIDTNLQSNLNRGVTLLAFGAWLFTVLAARRTVAWTVSTSLMLAFVTWGLMTLFWAGDPAVGWNKSQVYALRLILFLIIVVNVIVTERDLTGLLAVLAIAGWIRLLAGVGTLAAGGYTLGTRLQILATNMNDLGIVALVTLPGMVGLALAARGAAKVILTALAMLFIALTLLLVALSGSRGGAISLAIMLLALCCWKPTRLWGLWGTGLAVAGLLLTPAAFTVLLERLAVEEGDTLLGGREALWQAAVLLIRDHALTGVGLGEAPYALLRYLGEAKAVSTTQGAPIHNPLLTIWAETGLVGFVLYVGVLAAAVGAFVAAWGRERSAAAGKLGFYFPLIAAAAAGYAFSWIKGGGIESDFSYFLLLALLLIPARIQAAGQGAAYRRDMRSGEAGLAAAANVVPPDLMPVQGPEYETGRPT